MTNLEITLIALLTIIIIVSIYCIISYETELKSLRASIFEKDKINLKQSEQLDKYFSKNIAKILTIMTLSGASSPEQLDDKTEKRLKAIKQEIKNLQQNNKLTLDEIANFLTILTNN